MTILKNNVEKRFYLMGLTLYISVYRGLLYI